MEIEPSLWYSDQADRKQKQLGYFILSIHSLIHLEKAGPS